MKALLKPLNLLVAIVMLTLLGIGINRHLISDNDKVIAAVEVHDDTDKVDATEIVDLTNAERQKRGLSALIHDDKLAVSALAKCNDMVNQNYRGHYGPDNSKPWDFMKAVGVEYKEAGENLAYGQPSSAEVVRQWMASPGHREAILHNYTNVGIATCIAPDYNGKQAIYTVQHFTVVP